MALKQLNHVTIATADLEATRDFYRQVLGLETGPRPPLPFPGYWMYCGEQAAIHLVPHANNLGGGPDRESTGNFDHVAFTAEDFDGTCAHLDQLGITYRRQAVPGAPIRQIFLTDPNAVMVELNFFGV
ncbi:VOC family protein [Zavarzinia sp. CC-PAN008]|uniref:VOC family protein n=1 Tax=Zavarzinia sp. CC-PAN008 TaxID=3243332 RepID=UPI003F74829D